MQPKHPMAVRNFAIGCSFIQYGTYPLPSDPANRWFFQRRLWHHSVPGGMGIALRKIPVTGAFHCIVPKMVRQANGGQAVLLGLLQDSLVDLFRMIGTGWNLRMNMQIVIKRIPHICSSCLIFFSITYFQPCTTSQYASLTLYYIFISAKTVDNTKMVCYTESIKSAAIFRCQQICIRLFIHKKEKKLWTTHWKPKS